MAGGQMTTFQRRLVRDGLQTAWGFRLQGGKDFNQPLTVQRVFTGSPAEGELQRGDVVIAINNRDTNTLIHKEALDIIKRSGSELLLSVQRGPNRYQTPTTPGTPQVPYEETMNRYHNYQLHQSPEHHTSYQPYLAAPQHHPPPQQHLYQPPHQPASPPKQGYRPVQFSTTGPVPVSPTKTATYGIQYGPAGGQQGPMINRVQESLANVTFGRPEDEEDYDYKTVSQRKAAFQQGGGGPRRPPQSRGRKWQPPSSGGGGMNFGWSPSVRPDPTYRPGPPTGEAMEYKPTRQAGPSHQPAPRRQVQPQQIINQVESDEPPAWRGSLKKAGSTTPSGTYKAVQFNPNQPAGMNPIRVVQPQAGINQGPQAVHLQYNSPLGLYNKSSADEALRGQTAGRPGQGTLMITGGDGKQEIDWNKSHVYQMIHGQEKEGPKAARYTEFGDNEIRYDGFQDHSRQSRSFQMLQNQVADDMPPEGEEIGSSDF